MRKLKEYIIFTVYLWVAYVLVYLPLAIFVWQLNSQQLLYWLITGLPINLVVNYPIAKGLQIVEVKIKNARV